MILLVILFVILLIVILVQYKNAYPMPKTSVVGFTGTMGSGKTFSAVNMLRREYRLRRLVWAFQSVIWAITPKSKRGSKPVPPSVWSNIPLLVKYHKKRPIYANPVTADLLTCEDRFPENALVLLDEISVICDQYDFDDPLVMERFGRLMKFFRHWTGGKVYITEQAVSCVTKPIRDKMGVVYQCEGLSRWLGVMPFVKVRIRPLLMVDAEVSAVSDEVDRDDVPYLFFYSLPRLLQSRKKRPYDSRCYKPIYHEGASRKPDFAAPALTTRYLIDVVSDDTRKKEYKRSRQMEKDWIYKDSSSVNPENAPRAEG